MSSRFGYSEDFPRFPVEPEQNQFEHKCSEKHGNSRLIVRAGEASLKRWRNTELSVKRTIQLVKSFEGALELQKTKEMNLMADEDTQCRYQKAINSVFLKRIPSSKSIAWIGVG